MTTRAASAAPATWSCFTLSKTTGNVVKHAQLRFSRRGRRPRRPVQDKEISTKNSGENGNRPEFAGVFLFHTFLRRDAEGGIPYTCVRAYASCRNFSCFDEAPAFTASGLRRLRCRRPRRGSPAFLWGSPGAPETPAAGSPPRGAHSFRRRAPGPFPPPPPAGSHR